MGFGGCRPFDQRNKDQRNRQISYQVRVLDDLFLIFSLVKIAPADLKKLFDPKLNKNKLECDQILFDKETVCALQYLFLKLFSRRSESCEFLGQFITYS